jgi:hypothetical protein
MPGSDEEKMDKISQLVDLKRQYLSDTSTSLEDRAPIITQIQDEIWNTAKSTQGSKWQKG